MISAEKNVLPSIENKYRTVASSMQPEISACCGIVKIEAV